MVRGRLRLTMATAVMRQILQTALRYSSRNICFHIDCLVHWSKAISSDAVNEMRWTFMETVEIVPVFQVIPEA